MLQIAPSSGRASGQDSIATHKPGKVSRKADKAMLPLQMLAPMRALPGISFLTVTKLQTNQPIAKAGKTRPLGSRDV
jgi:hypothetical protein